MRALGALRPEGDAAGIRQVALDDADLWRRPLRVLRRAARLARVRDERPLAVRARFVLRACGRLRCSAGDLRRPAGPAHLAALLAMLPLALAGVLLAGPPLLAAAARFRGLPVADLRYAILRLAPLVAMPYGLVLAAAGGLAAGAWGLLLPLVAATGLACAGTTKQLAMRVRGSVAVRRHGRRVRRRLEEFDRLVAEAGG